MRYSNSNKTKWQKSYISQVFSRARNGFASFTDIALSDMELINVKSQYLPRSLFKFYSISASSIMDIYKGRIWLSDPNSFNDPYDCDIGYSQNKYEKEQLLRSIKENSLIGDSDDQFTEAEYYTLYNSQTSELENIRNEYRDVKYRILCNKNTSFQQKIFKMTRTIEFELAEIIKTIKKQNVRVACFSGFDGYTNIYDKLEMWAHYADNHKGFCVEYDISC